MRLGYGPRSVPGPRCASWSGVVRVALIAGRLASARRLGVAWALGMLSMVACTSLAPQPKLTLLEREALQTREFAAPYAKVFPAVLSVFQDMGYKLGESDKEAGYINGHGEYLSAWDSFWERVGQLGQSGQTTLQVRTEVEAITLKRTKVRVVLMKDTTSFLGINTMEDEEGTTIVIPITKSEITTVSNPEPYQTFFERLKAAISVPQNSR